MCRRYKYMPPKRVADADVLYGWSLANDPTHHDVELAVGAAVGEYLEREVAGRVERREVDARLLDAVAQTSFHNENSVA